MQLEPTGRPILDPFFAAVRRRHPDVDLVVLPPERRVHPTVAVGTSDEAVADLLVRLTHELARLWSALAPDDIAEPVGSLRYGDVKADVRVVSRVSAVRTDGSAVLGRLGNELEDLGWAVRRRSGEVEQLSASHEQLRVHTSYAAGSDAVVLSLSSASLSVGADRARVLVRAGGR